MCPLPLTPSQKKQLRIPCCEQDCRFQLKSEQDVARERAEALQADQLAQATLERRQREFASEVCVCVCGCVWVGVCVCVCVWE